MPNPKSIKSVIIYQGEKKTASKEVLLQGIHTEDLAMDVSENITKKISKFKGLSSK